MGIPVLEDDSYVRVVPEFLFEKVVPDGDAWAVVGVEMQLVDRTGVFLAESIVNDFRLCPSETLEIYSLRFLGVFKRVCCNV